MRRPAIGSLSRWMFALVAVALLALPAMAFAQEYKIKQIPKVDNFIFLVDHSPSMTFSHDTLGKKKIVLAKDTLTRMNKAIPALPYKAGLYDIANFKTRLAMAGYNKGAMGSAIGGIETDYFIMFRGTPLGMGLQQLDKDVLKKLSGKTAVIVVSDGKSNYGPSAIAVAKGIYKEYSGNVCFHTIYVGDTPEGEAAMAALGKLNACSVSTTAAALQNQAALENYVQEIFWTMEKEKIVRVKPAPVPAPVVPEEKVIVFRGLNFAFDSAKIEEQYDPILNEALTYLEQNPNIDIVIEGHTDSTGPEAYNMGLSERRAKSVEDWLAAHGVNVNRMSTKGFGEANPKYDNATKEGRRLNRRVEIKVQ